MNLRECCCPPPPPFVFPFHLVPLAFPPSPLVHCCLLANPSAIHPIPLILRCLRRIAAPFPNRGMAQVRPNSQLLLDGFPDGQGYCARTRTVPDMTGHVRMSDRYKPHWGKYRDNPHRSNAFFYFSPLYYQSLHPDRYAPTADLAPFKYNTDWALYKGPWFDYTEWFHYKRWYTPFYDMHAYHANLLDNY